MTTPAVTPKPLPEALGRCNNYECRAWLYDVQEAKLGYCRACLRREVCCPLCSKPIELVEWHGEPVLACTGCNLMMTLAQPNRKSDAAGNLTTLWEQLGEGKRKQDEIDQLESELEEAKDDFRESEYTVSRLLGVKYRARTAVTGALEQLQKLESDWLADTKLPRQQVLSVLAKLKKTKGELDE